jgi:TnpA family transposase
MAGSYAAVDNSRQHALYQIMKAFGQIIKSLFILRYIDDLALRQAVEKQLNKVELANRFTRAVAVGNPREYIQTEKGSANHKSKQGEQNQQKAYQFNSVTLTPCRVSYLCWDEPYSD